MPHVTLDWHRIEWRTDETPRTHVFPRLEQIGLSRARLERSVYVIRLNGNFCIQYPKGTSPTIYIGEGNVIPRLNSHRNWAVELEELAGDFPFQVCVAVPRVRGPGNEVAYRDAEAALIRYFAGKYGTTPLWNKQYERRIRPSFQYSEQSMKEAVNKRSGAKYLWALRPMPSSKFNKYFEQPPR